MNPAVDKTPHQPEAPLWQSGLDQRLVYRLLRPLFQAGLLDSRLARRILTQFEGIRERLSLGRDIARRYGRRQFEAADAVPVVHAEWITAPPVRVDRLQDREILEHQRTNLVVRAVESQGAPTQASTHFEPSHPLLQVQGRALSTEQEDPRRPTQSAPEPMRKAATQGMEPTSQHPGRLGNIDVPIASRGQAQRPSAAEVRKQVQEAGLPILSPRGKQEPLTVPPPLSLQMERSGSDSALNDHRAGHEVLTGVQSKPATKAVTEVPAASRGQDRKLSAAEVRKQAQAVGPPILSPRERQEPKAAQVPLVAELPHGPTPSHGQAGDRVRAVETKEISQDALPRIRLQAERTDLDARSSHHHAAREGFTGMSVEPATKAEGANRILVQPQRLGTPSEPATEVVGTNSVLVQPQRTSRDTRPLVGSEQFQLVEPIPIQIPTRTQAEGKLAPLATEKQSSVHGAAAVPVQRSFSSPQRTLAIGEAEMRELVGEVQRRLSKQWASDKSRRGMPR